MPFKIKIYTFVEQEGSEIYENEDEATLEADQIQLMHQDDVIALVVACDQDGNEV